MMKNLFYLIIRIRLHILWYSKMHCRRGERWHNGEQGRYSERGGENKIQGMKMEQQKQQKASEKIFLGLIKSKRQNNKSKSKIISVSCDQSTPQQTNKWEVSVLFLRNNFYVPTESQAIEQSTMSMCGCMCTLWGLMTGTGFNTNKRHKQQAVISGPNELQWLLSVFQFHLHVDDMIWPKRMNCSNMMLLPSCGLAVWYSNYIWQSVEGLCWILALSGRRGGRMAPGPYLWPAKDSTTHCITSWLEQTISIPVGGVWGEKAFLSS